VSVRVQGSDDLWLASADLYVEAGLLLRSDWKAVPISAPVPPPGVKRPFRVRSTFTVPPTSKARLYITALGLYEAYLNGRRIGEDLFTPGWTSYHARLAYQTYDVTDLLTEGENVLGAWVGEGWYAGVLGYGGGTRDIYGDRTALIAQLEVDGQPIISTSQDWEWSHGAVVSSELYNGETYDTALPDTDFTRGEWSPVRTLPTPTIQLFSSQSPPVRVVSTIKPVEIITTPSGQTIVDFGQNFAGSIRILSDPPTDSTELVIRHAEVLEHGELGTRPLRYAKATDRLAMSGKSIKGYTPKFTSHGFRYAEVTGWPGLALSNLEGVVYQSSMERSGDFSCSHELINRLYQNCLWSTIGNTISVPTDCPQRDERLGWTGDICVFSPTMSYMFNTAGFLGEWLKDLAHDQKRLNGVVPIFVPDTGTDHSYPEAIWGDASVLTPYDLYQASGDAAVLSTQYESVTSWLNNGVQRDTFTGLWSKAQDQLADWLAPKASPDTPNMGPSDNMLVADAWLIHSTKIAAKIARALGKEDDAVRRDHEAEVLTTMFYREYVTPSGRVVSDTQTALCLLLRYDIFPTPKNGSAKGSSADYRKIFATRLVELVRRANWQVDTGFAGTPIVLQTLASTGNIDHAYRMLQSRNCPSWLACVLLGATTIWERWDSMLADGTINPGEMTSFNHYALGSVASFMHEHIGGLSPLEPGWKRILVRPQPGGTVSSAKTSHVGPYGRISSEWCIAGGQLKVDIVVPPNSTAEIVLPGLERSVGSGAHSFAVAFEQPAFPPKVYEPHFAPVRPNEWVE